MKVLLSIKPEYAEKILSGDKKYEFRKTLFKNPLVKTVVIYATMPVGEVVGEFDFEEVLSGSPTTIWSKTRTHSGITRGFFNSYFEGKSKAHAIKVKSVRRYKTPKKLKDILPSGAAPQSFCYLYEGVSRVLSVV